MWIRDTTSSKSISQQIGVRVYLSLLDDDIYFIIRACHLQTRQSPMALLRQPDAPHSCNKMLLRRAAVFVTWCCNFLSFLPGLSAGNTGNRLPMAHIHKKRARDDCRTPIGNQVRASHTTNSIPLQGKRSNRRRRERNRERGQWLALHTIGMPSRVACEFQHVFFFLERKKENPNPAKII